MPVPDPDVLDHALFIILAVLFPLRAATFGYRRLARASEHELPRVRRSVYAQAAVLQWSLCAVVLVRWALAGRLWRWLGLVPRVTWGLGGVLVGFAIVAGMIARQRRQALDDDEALERVRARFRHVQRMLPTTPDELAAFYRLSVTAGICEELLYRGFVIWYLVNLTLALQHHAMAGGGPHPGWMHLTAGAAFWPAAALSSLVFGVGHAYQGARGMLLTGVAGMFFAAVYWITGSLFAPMLLHALMDAHSGNLLYHALARERALAAAAHEEATAE
jgi:CAAX protease family protein